MIIDIDKQKEEGASKKLNGGPGQHLSDKEIHKRIDADIALSIESLRLQHVWGVG